jgi:TM2 domain-containing membrane protein YozV
MNTYYMIGGDGRQYGPVSVDQIKQWATEGRATAQTLLRVEGGEWKPLATYPEFAGVMTSPPPVVTGSGWPPPMATKSRIAAGVLGIFLGGLGVHRFYLGYVPIGVVQIVVTILTCGLGQIWGFIEGICILAGAAITTDADGRPMRD